MVCFLAPVLAGFLDLAAGLKPASCFSPPSPDEIRLFFTHRLSPLPWFGCPLLLTLLTLLTLSMSLKVGCRAGCQDPSHTPNASRVHPSLWFPHDVRGHHCPPAFCWRGETSQTSPQVVVLETPLTWAGRQMGQEPPRPCPALPARSPAIYAAFVLFLIPLMFIICPTGLTDFVSCRAAAVAEPPRLPRSRLPAPSRADLVFRAAPRRISVCKTKCFDGGRLQECLEAVWSFMGCAVRAVLARRAGLPGMGSVIFSLWRGCCWKERQRQGQQERGVCKNLPVWDPKSIIIINNCFFLNENAPCSTSPREVQELVALPGQGRVMVSLLTTTSSAPRPLLHHSRRFPKAPQGSP